MTQPSRLSVLLIAASLFALASLLIWQQATADSSPSAPAARPPHEGGGGNPQQEETTNQPPEFIYAYKRGVFENSAAGTSVGKPVTASDPDGDTVTYTLSGDDSGLFVIDANGQIKVAEGTTLDHETTPSYAITVHADDGNGGAASVPITVNVKNVVELPAVSFSGYSSGPEAHDVAFRLTRSGGDRPDQALTVNVSIAETGNMLAANPPTAVDFAAGSATATLTVPTVDDSDDEADSVVTATITAGDGYTIGSPSSQTATVTDDDNAQPASEEPDPPPNQSPQFIYAYRRGVFENSAAGTNVGKPVTASDPDGDTVAYTLSGDNAGLFVIDASGQIKVAEGTTLDHETTPSYAITVHAGDGNGGAASVPITVNVKNVYEQPTVSFFGHSSSPEWDDATFLLTRVGDRDQLLTVNVSISETGNMLAANPPAAVDFAAGSADATLTVPTVDDDVDEPDSVVTATINAGDGYAIGSPSSQTATVHDDDEPVRIEPQVDGASDPLQFTGTVPPQFWRFPNSHQETVIPPAIGGSGTFTYSVEGLPGGIGIRSDTVPPRPYLHGIWGHDAVSTEGEAIVTATDTATNTATLKFHWRTTSYYAPESPLYGVDEADKVDQGNKTEPKLFIYTTSKDNQAYKDIVAAIQAERENGVYAPPTWDPWYRSNNVNSLTSDRGQGPGVYQDPVDGRPYYVVDKGGRLLDEGHTANAGRFGVAASISPDADTYILVNEKPVRNPRFRDLVQPGYEVRLASKAEIRRMARKGWRCESALAGKDLIPGAINPACTWAADDTETPDVWVFFLDPGDRWFYDNGWNQCGWDSTLIHCAAGTVPRWETDDENDGTNDGIGYTFHHWSSKPSGLKLFYDHDDDGINEWERIIWSGPNTNNGDLAWLKAPYKRDRKGNDVSFLGWLGKSLRDCMIRHGSARHC